MNPEYLVFILLGFTTSLASAVIGFGSALLVLAIGPYFLPIKEVIALSAILFLVSTLSKSVVFVRYIDWKLVAIMSVASFPFAYLGASVVSSVSVLILERLLGGMILIYILLDVFDMIRPLKIRTRGLLFGAMGYGFISGILGSGNLVKAILFRELKFSKESFIGAMAATSVLANFAKIIAYKQSGLLNERLLFPAIGLGVSAVCAVLFGRYLLRRVTNIQFTVAVQFVLGVSAIGLLV